MGRVAAILVAGVVLIGGITLLSMNRMSVGFVGKCVEQYDCAIAHSNAVSAANMAIGALVRGESLQEFSNAQLFDGWISLDTLHLADSLIKVVSRGFIPAQDTATVEAVIDFRQGSGASYEPRAAVITQCDLTTTGQLVIDGRNHNLLGQLVAQTGTLAVSTTQTFERKGNSKIGGTYGGVDYAPVKSYPSFLVEEMATWPDGFPDKPDKVFGGDAAGFSEGRLKEIAQSGVGGSQYVIDPTDLTWPLNSVTYVELPSGDEWTNINFGTSQGILVVHNAQTNARMGKINPGEFKGILIADNINKIDGSIDGAVILLAQSANSWNGAGKITLSREAVEKALFVLRSVSPQNCNIISWYESL